MSTRVRNTFGLLLLIYRIITFLSIVTKTWSFNINTVDLVKSFVHGIVDFLVKNNTDEYKKNVSLVKYYYGNKVYQIRDHIFVILWD